MSNLISLVMTVYNREKYLAAAIDSVRAQTYPHWQLTIWDDGSTDGSIAIAREYAQLDSRIRFVAAIHAGSQHALRKAIDTATGAYIGSVDSDDLLAPDALAATVTILDTQPQIGMVYSDHWIIDADGKVQGISAKCQIPYSPDRLLIDFMTFQFRLIRREIYDLVGGIDLAMRYADDYDLCLKISEVTEIHHLRQPLFYYRRHAETMSVKTRDLQTECSALAVRNALVRRGLSDRYQLNVSPTGVFQLRKRADLATISEHQPTVPAPTRGVCYCATGNLAYLEAALISALRLRQLEPDLPITIVSDNPLIRSIVPPEYRIEAKFVRLPQELIGSSLISRLVKIEMWQLTDYDETLFLDADILPLQPLTQIWQYLDRGSLALAVDYKPTIADCNHIAPAEQEYTATICPGSTPQYNGGVFLWRRGADTERLFRAWQQEWCRFKQHDQLALVRAIHQTEFTIVELPKSYNFPLVDLPSGVSDNKPQIHLLHCWGGCVMNGTFRQIAQRLHPEVTTVVSSLMEQHLNPRTIDRSDADSKFEKVAVSV
jgi:glycosyltransferase involved in cell wall biosynthesis